MEVRYYNKNVYTTNKIINTRISYLEYKEYIANGDYIESPSNYLPKCFFF